MDHRRLLATLLLLSAPLIAATKKGAPAKSALEPQSADAGYTAKIKQYTTEPFFLTELVDHLPASATVPTPEKVLGYIVGAPDKLTYTKDIYRYMRELEKASPRVKVFVTGKSEEGRDTLLVAVSDEENIQKLDHYRQITGRLADPRKTSEAEAKQFIEDGLPMYWASGSIHSPETGSPEMLMELAYRLAVEESPFIQTIRKNSIVLITPCTEVDGRDRAVDLYNYHKEYPNRAQPNQVYWGKYVAHDNNRDGLSMSLQLSKIVMKTFLDFHPQVLHDLHESVPFLYTSTGMGPYNAWLDPMVVNEWQKMAYVEIEEMTKRGVPGVWTHGFYDGWAPNYMFYAANGHNSIGRFYETYGGRGADTLERTIPAAQTTRTWFRPNPPLPKVKWSLRNNINLQESAILFAMNYTAVNRKQFLENFYLKSRRSVEKASKEGPAAWVIPSDDPRPVECAELVKVLQYQGVEVHKLDDDDKRLKVPSGSYIVRMDQPYSRMADMLLDKQYYNVSDPRPYDDTGWTLGAVHNVKTVRVTDMGLLRDGMTLLQSAPKVEGDVVGSTTAGVYLINHNTDNTLATLRFRLKDLRIQVAEEPFKMLDRDFAAGTFIIATPEANVRASLEKAVGELGLKAFAAEQAPKVPTHDLAVPRIALVHSWLNTQSEGWYRIAFDQLQIPYTYLSDQNLAKMDDLRQKFDVIIFGPTPGSAQRVVNGLPKIGQPIPWKGSELTPNLAASPDTTDDMRGGLGLAGLEKVVKFVEDGGLFVTVAPNVTIPIDYGLVDGISIVATRELQARGSVLMAVISDKKSPITYGYGEKLPVYFSQSPVLQVSTTGGTGGGAGGGPFGEVQQGRPSGRGTAADPDVVQGRSYTPPPPKPEVKPGEEPPLDDETREMLRAYLPSAEMRPRVVLRFAEEKELLVSGMLAGGRELTRRPVVVDAPKGKGHILLFANNPMWRNETQGSYFLLFNAMLNYDHLGVGVRSGGRGSPVETAPTSGAEGSPGKR